METGDKADRRGLRLIRGGRDRSARYDGTLHVVVAAPSDAPFDVDAVVVEDDTYFVLGASPEVREPTGSPLRIWTELHETEPATPGTVALRPGRPARLSAVVHELSRDPTWTEEWVSRALGESFRLARENGFRSLGLQPLGCVHGRLAPERFAALLHRALEELEPRSLGRLWLIGDPEVFDLSLPTDRRG